MRKIVKQHVPDTAAQNNAYRYPQHKVVEVGDGQARLAAPKFFRADEQPPVSPADQDAEDIGQGIPANGKWPELYQDRVKVWIWNNEQRHLDVRIRGRAPTDKW